MGYARVAGCALALSAVAACSRHGPDAVPASAAAGGDEGPRIATSPDNVHIDYRVYGHGDPAVVLVHGWASDANYWNAQLPALESRYRSEERRVGKECRRRWGPYVLRQ